MRGCTKRLQRVFAMMLAFVMVFTTLALTDADPVSAASELMRDGDYRVTASDESDSQCKLTFTPAVSAAYVIAHYKVNDAGQMNVTMAKNQSNWEYVISGLKKGDKIDCSFTYNINGVQKDTPSATHVTGRAASVDASLEAPFGLVATSPADGVIGVVWGRGNVDCYNVYIDGNRVSSNVGCGYYEYSGYAKGSHEVAVATVSGGSESVKTSVWVTVNGAGSSTPVETPTETPVDTAIPAPFGLVVSNPSDNTVGVVWGRGSVDCYNVYIDGNKVAEGVACGYYTYGNVTAGEHKVAVATVKNGKESAKTEASVSITGASQGTQPEQPGEPEQPGQEESGDIPQIPGLAARSDRMYFKLNNKTNGQYADNQVYWCILGYDSDNQLCYVDKNGNLVRATAGMNTVAKGNRMCADICYTLAEKDYVYMPDIISGRMYFSYGEQVYITFNVAADGKIGYAGPDLNNETDPNQDVLFEFIEFTIKNKEYWGNTSRVDFYSFPMATRLIGQGGFNNYPGDADVYDRTVGDLGSRADTFAAYKNEVPAEFQTLITEKRIVAPCKLTFNEGSAYANYYDAYINEFWNKYATQDLVFSCEAGTFRGRVSGDVMRFTKDGDNGTYYVYKPTTQDVLEGKGYFNRGNSTELVIEAQLCAAFNRGVAMQPENFDNESAYYKNPVSNFYAGFFHNHAYGGYAYGFCYDDVFDHSTLLHYTNPTGLIVDLKW